jgi:hypothetical protein
MAITTDWIDRIFYDANGYTGKVFYFRLVRRGDGYIWNDSSKKLENYPAWADSAILLFPKGTTGGYEVRIPWEVTSGHVYDVVIYEQAGGSPVVTDIVAQQYDLKIGDIFGI